MKSIKNAHRWLTLIIAVALISSGCSSVGAVKVASKPIERTPLALANPEPLALDLPKWRVITPENVEQVWAELAKNGQEVVLIAVTPGGFEQLTMDLSRLKSLINEQRIIILEYKKYYESK